MILSVEQARQSTRIQALVIVHQQLDGTYVSFESITHVFSVGITLKPLGYCRFPLYIPQKIGNLDTWDVTIGPVQRALHPGLPPISIDMIPDTPSPFVPGT